MVEKKFITKIGNKEFITFEGLLNEFHSNGGKSIDTEIVSPTPLVIKATVSGTKGTFSGMGDANASNVTAMVAKHIIRMAETRAIARALRWYNNIGMCSADELGDNNQEVNDAVVATQMMGITKKPIVSKGTAKKLFNPNLSDGVKTNNECSKCGEDVPDNVKDFSNRAYGTTLCFACQKLAKAEEEKQEELVE